MFFSNKRILVLAPHIDDGEFGCGGTISRCLNENSEVRYVAFSDCRDSLKNRENPELLRDELRNSMNSYGINNEDVKVLNYQVRVFSNRRQDILQDLIEIKNDYDPDIVFTPCSDDIHQDHQVISQETLRAFKRKTILGYELPWNNLRLPSDVIVKISKDDLDNKIRAIHCYQSQKHRVYHDDDYLKSLAKTRGVRIGEDYAEAFELIRLIL